MAFGAYIAALGVAAILTNVTLPAEATVHRSSKSSDVVYFRPVLCFAPAYNPRAPNPGLLSASSCSPASRLDQTSLRVTPSDLTASGFTIQNVAPDLALAGVPSTKRSQESASATVLLPGSPSADWPGVRYLLGPAEMTSASITEASAAKVHRGVWVVDYVTTEQGMALFDNVAKENFHLYLGIDFNGKVVSIPIIQPTQSSFSSFHGQGEVSGNFTKAEALALAKALHQG